MRQVLQMLERHQIEFVEDVLGAVALVLLVIAGVFVGVGVLG